MSETGQDKALAYTSINGRCSRNAAKPIGGGTAGTAERDVVSGGDGNRGLIPYTLCMFYFLIHSDVFLSLVSFSLLSAVLVLSSLFLSVHRVTARGVRNRTRKTTTTWRRMRTERRW